ncbi:hypothetical protein [Cellulosimicrobium funkei]
MAATTNAGRVMVRRDVSDLGLGCRSSRPSTRTMVPDASVETRRFTAAPMFEAYVIKRCRHHFGYYPLVKRDGRTSGRQVSIYDPMGKDTVLYHWTGHSDIEAVDTQFVIETRNWIDGVWNTIAVEDPK